MTPADVGEVVTKEAEAASDVAKVATPPSRASGS
jgi:hypothetical protein